MLKKGKGQGAEWWAHVTFDSEQTMHKALLCTVYIGDTFIQMLPLVERCTAITVYDVPDPGEDTDKTWENGAIIAFNAFGMVTDWRREHEKILNSKGEKRTYYTGNTIFVLSPHNQDINQRAEIPGHIHSSR